MLKNTGERLILEQSWNLMTTLEHLHRYNAVREHIAGKNILDAACGTGYGSHIMSQTASRVIGVDLSIDAIEYAKHHYQNDNLEYRNMSISDLDFGNEKFDVITSFETIEHVPSLVQKKFLEQTVDLLTDDGVLFISTPNDQLLRDITFGKYTNEFHISEFTESEYLAFLNNYYPYVKIFYQTVAEVSTIVPKGQQLSEEARLISMCPHNTLGRYYIAVCSKKELPNEFSFQSVFVPEIMEYFTEHYYTKSATAYIDIGNGFDGKSMSRTNYITKTGDTFRCYFDFSDFKSIKAVRFDPCEHGCECSITDIKSNLQDIKLVPLNSVFKENGVDIFHTLDPIYLVQSDHISEIKWLEVSGHIIQIADHIVQSKMDMLIQQKDSEINRNHILYLGRNREVEEEKKALEFQVAELQSKYEECQEHCKVLADELFDIKKVLSQHQAHKDSMWRDIQYLQQQNNIFVKRKQKLEESIIWKATKPIRISLALIKKMYTKLSIKKLIAYMFTNDKICKTLKNIDGLFKKRLGSNYNYIFGNLKSRLKKSVIETIVDAGPTTDAKNDFIGEKKSIEQSLPLVSVIVPNYNHSSYLRERLDTIYGQKYQNFEVILLDDCSTDNSRDILLEYAERYKDKTTVVFNETNSGYVFKQWNKGIGLAKGDYIWIAESDDYCTDNFLDELVPLFGHQSVMLAFARSVFMQDGKQIWSTEEYLADLPAFKWDNPFTITAHTAVNNGFAIKNIIPNVSSMMFRNISKIPQDVVDIWQNIKLCGDWIFYLSIIKGGTISYTNAATNYYRIHAKSTSLKTQETMRYYDEHEMVSEFVVKNYNVDISCFKIVLHNLQEHYKAVHKSANAEIVLQHYRIEKIALRAKERKPNVAMCCFSMQMGGGETYPLYLANEMKSQGIAVTVLDFCMGQYDKRVRSILSDNIPLVRIDNLMHIATQLTQLGIDVIHSHHASVDNVVATWLNSYPNDIKHIISLHGMYEAINKDDLRYVQQNISKTCSQFIFTAYKNLETFKDNNLFDVNKFIKLDNGLPNLNISIIERNTLDIPDDSFILCLVSRAFAEKGWREAIEAVQIANRKSQRSIHLILIGEGELYDQYKNIRDNHIHLIGASSRVRDYFAMSDYGFLPSRFSGESYPLVVIDCLLAGKPVLASDIGEIRNQLTSPQGEIAGEIFLLHDMKIDVEELSNIILKLASEDIQDYIDKQRIAVQCSNKFSIEKIVKQYLSIYDDILNRGE